MRGRRETSFVSGTTQRGHKAGRRTTTALGQVPEHRPTSTASTTAKPFRERDTNAFAAAQRSRGHHGSFARHDRRSDLGTQPRKTGDTRRHLPSVGIGKDTPAYPSAATTRRPSSFVGTSMKRRDGTAAAGGRGKDQAYDYESNYGSGGSSKHGGLAAEEESSIYYGQGGVGGEDEEATTTRILARMVQTQLDLLTSWVDYRLDVCYYVLRGLITGTGDLGVKRRRRRSKSYHFAPGMDEREHEDAEADAVADQDLSNYVQGLLRTFKNLAPLVAGVVLLIYGNYFAMSVVAYCAVRAVCYTDIYTWCKGVSSVYQAVAKDQAKKRASKENRQGSSLSYAVSMMEPATADLDDHVFLPLSLLFGELNQTSIYFLLRTLAQAGCAVFCAVRSPFFACAVVAVVIAEMFYCRFLLDLCVMWKQLFENSKNHLATLFIFMPLACAIFGLLATVTFACGYHICVSLFTATIGGLLLASSVFRSSTNIFTLLVIAGFLAQVTESAPLPSLVVSVILFPFSFLEALLRLFIL